MSTRITGKDILMNDLFDEAYNGNKTAQDLIAIRKNSYMTYDAICKLVKALQTGKSNGHDFGDAAKHLEAFIADVAVCYRAVEQKRAEEVDYSQ